MSKALDDLDPNFRLYAYELLARCAEAGVPVVVINTRRTEQEQAANIANGVSWIKHSKHLDGKAIDICPYALFDLHGADKLQWDSADPVWQKIGEIGERIGLRWGGRFKQRDMGHFELLEANHA